VDPFRRDDASEAPVYVRPAPVRRHIAVSVVVTFLAVAALVSVAAWLASNTGPIRAFALVLGVPLAIASVASIHWAWKKHPF
jgi:hypothetical protein